MKPNLNADLGQESLEDLKLSRTRIMEVPIAKNPTIEEGRPVFPEGFGKKGEQVDLVGTTIIKVADIKRELDTQPVALPKRNVKKQPNYKLFGILGVVVIAVIGLLLFFLLPSKSEPKETTVTKTEQKNLPQNEKITVELDKKAETSGLPHKASTKVIGGGYILGTTVYHPDEPTKLYTDFELFAPENKQEVSNDETAKKINAEFQKTLPKLGDTIEVKDKEKTTIETYKMSDGTYQTIALFDGKPFAYIVTDKDGHHTNNVTSFYISDVAK